VKVKGSHPNEKAGHARFHRFTNTKFTFRPLLWAIRSPGVLRESKLHYKSSAILGVDLATAAP
jgi:hypothetical protein